MTPYIFAFVLFAVGIYGLLVKRNLVKIIMSIMIIKYAVNVFFMLTAYKSGMPAPILYGAKGTVSIANPIPQAMVLTSIMVGLALIAVMAVLALRIYEKYGTFDILRIRRLRG